MGHQVRSAPCTEALWEILAGLLRRGQRDGSVPAGTDPQGTARICAAIQGLVLQQAWNPELDIATCIDAVIALIDAITQPARN